MSNPAPSGTGGAALSTPAQIMDRTVKRFASKVKVDPVTGCHFWTAYIMSCGYGQFGIHGKVKLAHRVAYEMYVGPIPEGLHLDHLCRNRACVNPAHLEAVTNAENCRRGMMTKLTEIEVREIRASTEDSRDIAARYGICRSHVYQVRDGRIWKDVA